MLPSDMLASLLIACAPLVDPTTAAAVVRVESAGNPFAIGVVAGRLDRQPRSAAEALATASHLQRAGWNFSLGLAQINVRNLDRLGLDIESVLQLCANLRAMQSVLIECYQRQPVGASGEQQRLRRALSCYYSGNAITGFRHGYVQRVARAAQ